jgi:hypothetical protein
MAGLAALTSACTAVPYAAVVGGQVISNLDLQQNLAAQVANKAYAAELGQSEGSLTGLGTGNYSMKLANQTLEVMISDRLVQAELAHLGVKVTPVDTVLAAMLVPSGFPPGVFAGFSRTYQSRVIARQANTIALEAALGHIDLSGPDLGAYYLRHRDAFATACVSGVEFPTVSAAESAEVRLITHQTTFARLLATNSASGQGGSLGCHGPNAYANLPGVAGAIATLGVGRPSAPISLSPNPGVVILEVTSRRDFLSFSQAINFVRRDLISTVNTATVDSILTRELHTIGVQVNPRYGQILNGSLEPPTTVANTFLPILADGSQPKLTQASPAVLTTPVG